MLVLSHSDVLALLTLPDCIEAAEAAKPVYDNARAAGRGIEIALDA